MSQRLTDDELRQAGQIVARPTPKQLRRLSAAIYDRAIARGDVLPPQLRTTMTTDAAAVLTEIRKMVKEESPYA